MPNQPQHVRSGWWLSLRKSFPLHIFGRFDPVALLIALAISFAGLAQGWIYEPLPKRTVWLLCCVMGTMFVYLPIYHLMNRFFSPRWRMLPVQERSGLILSLAMFTTIVMLGSSWTPSQLPNTIWLFPDNIEPILRIGLWLANATVLATLFAIPLFLVIQPGMMVTSTAAPWFSWRIAVVGMVVFAALLPWPIIAYIRAESGLYSWDFAGYWMVCDHYGEKLTQPGQITSTLGLIWQSMQGDDYPLSTGIIPMLTRALIGPGRVPYILSIALGYALPIMMMLWMALRGVMTSQIVRPSWWVMMVPMVVFATLPFMWSALLRGYLDCGGVVFCMGVIAIYLRRPVQQLAWYHLALIGVVLAGMVMFRRWYAYWAIGFMSMMVLECLWEAMRGPARSLGARLQAFRPVIGVGSVSAMVVGSLAWPLVVRMVTTPAELFQAYKLSLPFIERIWNVIQAIGLGWCCVLGLSALWLLRDRSTRRGTIVLMGMLPITYWLFQKRVDPAPHHYYLFAPTFLWVLSAAGIRGVGAWQHAWQRLLPLSGMGVLGALAMLWVFHPQWNESRLALRPWTTQPAYPPLQRGDMPEFARMLQTIQHEFDDGARGFVVLASSEALNPTQFMMTPLSFPDVPFPARGDQRITAEVDRSYGFPNSLLEADVIVVGTPPQIHLREADQQVIVQPTLSFMNGTDIAQAFRCLPTTFVIDQGVEAKIYRRVRPNTPEEIAALSARLRAIYPDHPFIYAPAQR